MKKILLWIMILFPVMANAEIVQVDGIWYSLSTDFNASVVANSEAKYSGDIVIPESIIHRGRKYNVNFIAIRAFQDCQDLTSIIIPNSVNRIAPKLFEGCSSLSNVVMGNSIEYIGHSAFRDCTSLLKIHIPKSVTVIGEDAFKGCTNLVGIHIDDLKSWCEIYFDSETANPLYYVHRLFLNEKEIEELIIPESTRGIGNYAFTGCYNVKSIVLPKSVTKIGSLAFSDCSSLTNINTLDSVKFIGDGAFRNCIELTGITIPYNVKTIGAGTFSGCNSFIN